MELTHSEDGIETCESCMFADFDKGCLSELPVHVGEERREGRKEKEAREFDPRLFF